MVVFLAGLLWLVIAAATVYLFVYAFALALCLLFNAYFSFKESKFYEKFVIFIKEWNGEITGIEGEVGPDGSVNINKTDKVSQSDSPKELNERLNEAFNAGNTIDGKAAVRVKPTKDVHDELNDRVKRGR